MITSNAKKFFKSKTFTLILLLIALVAFFAITTKGVFINPKNIRSILNSMVLVSLLAIGEGLLIIFGFIDLSAGTIGTLGGVVLASLVSVSGLPWYLALIIAIAVGAACGFINSILVTKLRFQPFIATLAMASVAEGTAYVIGGAIAIPINDEVLSYIGTQKIGGFIPMTIIISLLALLIYGIILGKTKFGRSIYLCGGNRNAASLAGLKPDKFAYVLFANCGALSALAGCLFTMRLQSGTTTGITNLQFAGITAAILGGISFGGGAGGMGGCLVGLLIINCFNNGLTLLRVDPYWQTVSSGLLLIFALLFDYFTTRRAQKAHGGAK